MKTDDTSTLLIAAKLGQNIPQRRIGFFIALTKKKRKKIHKQLFVKHKNTKQFSNVCPRGLSKDMKSVGKIHEIVALLIVLHSVIKTD